jgi:long-chain acyl-CoA synthetase
VIQEEGVDKAFQDETLQSLLRSLASYGRRTAVMAFEKNDCSSWSFHDLMETARRLASGLIMAGLRRGTRAVVSAPGTVQWVIASCALVEAGAVPVPVDTQASDEDLRHILKDSEAQWIFTGAAVADRLAQTCTAHGCRLIVLDAGQDEARSWRRYLHEPQAEAPPVEPEDVALLFYTSGTTGLPKGVPLTHRNLTSNLRALARERLLSDTDRVLLPLPLHHVYPFTVGLLTPLASGIPVVLPYSLLGPQVLRALTEGAVTVVVAVPRFYAALTVALETRMRQYGAVPSALFRGTLRLSTALRRCCGWRLGRRIFVSLHRRFAPGLRMVASGGSALDPDVAWKLEGLGWEVASGYGLTETAPILTFNVPGSRRFDSAGIPLAGVAIRIADPDPHTGAGEVQAKGPNVFSGYLNLPDKTEEAFTDDGYFRTGDLGILKEGRLYLTGRVSSMIVLPGGENINPEQVEAVLEKSEAIHEAAVLEQQHRLVALLVPEPGAMRGVQAEELEARVRGDLQRLSAALPTHRRISDYAVTLEPLPRTRLGKIRRHKLGLLYAEAKRQGRPSKRAGALAVEDMAPEDRLLLEQPQALRVWEWLPGRFTEAWLTPHTHLHLDLGVDSLEWLNLTLELGEEIGITLPDDAIARIETVRDLLREAAEAGAATGAQEDLVTRLRRPRELLNPAARRWIHPPRAWERVVGKALLAAAKLLIIRGFGLTVRGAEFLPRTGPLVLVPNHVSLLDPLALLAALPPSLLQHMYWSGWTGIMFRNVFMRLLSRATRTVPINQGGGALTSLALGAAILDAGHPLVWFAEGGRSFDGTLQPFQPGVGLLLQSRPVTAVPVWIEGGHEALPRGARWPKAFRRMSVTFGQPIHPTELEGQRAGDRPHQRITAALHAQVAALACKTERHRDPNP